MHFPTVWRKVHWAVGYAILLSSCCPSVLGTDVSERYTHDFTLVQSAYNLSYVKTSSAKLSDICIQQLPLNTVHTKCHDHDGCIALWDTLCGDVMTIPSSDVVYPYGVLTIDDIVLHEFTHFMMFEGGHKEGDEHGGEFWNIFNKAEELFHVNPLPSPR
jgi:hypothetical protein